MVRLFFLLTLLSLTACASNTYQEKRRALITEAYEDPVMRQLVLGACNGNGRSVKDALSSGADPNGHGKFGQTPLHWSVFCRSKTGTKALLRAGANPNIVALGRVDGFLLSRGLPLHKAVQLPNPELTEILLKAGADPNAGGDLFFIMLEVSGDAWSGDLRKLNLLIAHGLDVDMLEKGLPSIPEAFRRTPLDTLVSSRGLTCLGLRYLKEKPRVNEANLLHSALIADDATKTDKDLACLQESRRILRARVSENEYAEWHREFLRRRDERIARIRKNRKD